jgi:hypothetical protein
MPWWHELLMLAFYSAFFFDWGREYGEDKARKKQVDLTLEQMEKLLYDTYTKTQKQYSLTEEPPQK